MLKGLFSSFIKNPRGTSYEGEGSDEQVQVLLRRSIYTVIPSAFAALIFFFLPFLLIPFMIQLKINGVQVFNALFLTLFVAFWYVLEFGLCFQIFMNWFFDVLIATNKKIVDINQGYKNISETLLINVQDITSTINGTVGEVLNIGSIQIQTAAEAEEFEFDMVDNPSLVRDAVSDLISNAKQHTQL